MIIDNFSGALNGVNLTAKSLLVSIETVDNGFVFKFTCEEFSTEHFIEKECYDYLFGDKTCDSVVFNILESITC